MPRWGRFINFVISLISYNVYIYNIMYPFGLCPLWAVIRAPNRAGRVGHPWAVIRWPLVIRTPVPTLAGAVGRWLACGFVCSCSCFISWAVGVTLPVLACSCGRFARWFVNTPVPPFGAVWSSVGRLACSCAL